MTGVFYGVGVGPGDPELMTRKAIRMIRENDCIALPGAVPTETIAYRIAVQAVPELAQKELIPIYMPMTRDPEKLERNHQKGTQIVESYLKQGKNVVFLTLGDPSIYSTYTYLQERVEPDCSPTAMVSGITSFCAAAARVGIPLVTGNEPLHIIPASHRPEEPLTDEGQYVLMKSGRRMQRVKEILAASGRQVVTVENCGTADERIYRGVEEIPDDAGYYSLIIARKTESEA